MTSKYFRRTEDASNPQSQSMDLYIVHGQNVAACEPVWPSGKALGW